MELAIRLERHNLMSELIPSFRLLNSRSEGYPSLLTVNRRLLGINSQTLLTGKRGSYNLRRSFGASVNYLLI